MRHDVSTPLNRACEWRIVVQRSVRSDFVVIARIGLQHPAQVRLAEYDYVVDAFTTDRPALGQKIEAVEGIVPVRRSSVGWCAAIEMMQQCIASPFLFLAVANYTRKNRRSLR
jgi:hypothetical protein